jgi:hypothetical protein
MLSGCFVLLVIGGGPPPADHTRHSQANLSGWLLALSHPYRIITPLALKPLTISAISSGLGSSSSHVSSSSSGTYRHDTQHMQLSVRQGQQQPQAPTDVAPTTQLSAHMQGTLALLLEQQQALGAAYSIPCMTHMPPCCRSKLHATRSGCCVQVS